MKEVENLKTLVFNFEFDNNYSNMFQINNLEFDPDEVILKHFCFKNTTDYGDPADDCYMYSLTTNMIDSVIPFHSIIIDPNNAPTAAPAIYSGYALPLQTSFLLKQPIRGRTFYMEVKNYDGNLIQVADANGLGLTMSFTFTFIKYK